jgi:ketosteroid isomerase-like protein
MSQENVKIVRRWWDGFNNDGMPPLSLCDEQIEIHMPPDFPVRGFFQGHEGVRRWREQVFEVAEDARVEPEEIVDVHDDGETVLMLLRATGTASYSKIKLDVEWAAIWTIRDGKLLRAKGYLNRAEALEAAGISE